ncbi:MAG TPA: hypothetical protein PLV45_17770 [bacterium]|nr:hypothetical protein [bacterium]
MNIATVKKMVSILFLVAAIYDGLLGGLFLFAGRFMFQWSGVTPPNHIGYVQFPGALLIVFAVMFVAVAVNPVKNRNLIPYGILLKLSYCGVVVLHWLGAGIPDMWKPFCIADFIFMLLFGWAWKTLEPVESDVS